LHPKKNSTLPTIDGDQRMFLVLIVAPEIADCNGPTLPPPAEQWSVMDRPELSSADPGLTPRQLDVLALMRQGRSNKAICRALDLAEPTVKNHVTAILKAFKVTNRTQAVIAASTLAWHSSSEGRAEPYPGRLDSHGR
jgi:DNA-binding CsgD family transcriptional regulator